MCCCCSVTQLYLTLSNPEDCSMPRFPGLHDLPEPAQTCARWAGNAIQPSVLCPSLLLLPSLFPSIRSFLLSQLSASGGQSIGGSASASVLPMNNQDWLPLGWTGWISLMSKGLSNHGSKTSIPWHSAFLMVQLSHPLYDYWKNHSFD